MTLVEAHDRVEARISELMGTINTATAELVELIAGVIENETWGTAGGIRSVEHWVTWQCGVSHRRAVDLVRMARRRDELPEVSKLFRSGQLSEDSMATIARRAPAERDEEIAAFAPALLHAQLRTLLRSLPKPDDGTPEPPPSSVEFGVDGERWILRANLAPDEGALVEKALTSARSQVFREHHPDAEQEYRGGSEVTWVDGLLRSAELSLHAVTGDGRRPADRYQVVLHVDPTDRRANLHLGEVVPDSIRRYLSCDADVRAMIENNEILAAISSRLRTVDDRMRLFIENRDGGCRVPGCEQKRWLHVHHIVHWEDGGRTESRNLCALCPMHHRLHHLGLLQIEGNPNRHGGLRFFDQHGRPIAARPPAVPSEAAVPSTPYTHPSGEPVNWHWFEWRTREPGAFN